VASPDQVIACGGEYELVPDQLPQGYPLWRKRGALRWIYTGLDHKWYIGGQSSADRNFKCASGFVFRDKRHDGVMPDRIGGPWERGNGSEWHPDPSILVTAAPVVAGADNETLTAALEVAGDWMRVQEDVPGVYTIVHDNTAVSQSVVASPPVIARLPLGTRVVVKEVVHRPQEDRVRGRLELPEGWISIRDMNDGYRWAKKEKHRAVADSSQPSTSEPSRELGNPRATITQSPLTTGSTVFTMGSGVPDDSGAFVGSGGMAL